MNDNLVYSTEKGDLRRKSSGKGQSKDRSCITKAPNGQHIKVRREKKGRAGKTVTVIYNLPLTSLELAVLAKKIKQLCGTGGTIKDDTIIIQGDNQQKIIPFLINQGYKVKKSEG